MSKLDHLSSNHVTSSSLGSRLNYNYTSHSTPPNRRSPSPYQSSIIQITREDGRVERRLETCSYQETEMVSDHYVLLRTIVWCQRKFFREIVIVIRKRILLFSSDYDGRSKKSLSST